MLTETDYLILDVIERHEPSSQRALASFSGMSLGKTNYVLKRLVDKGLVKISRFKESTRKGRYLYLLTPKGIEAKTRLTLNFIQDRMREFEDFRGRLLENLQKLKKEGVSRVLICSSDNVGKFLAHIARRENLGIEVIGTASNPEIFNCFEGDSYDCILIADDPKRFSSFLDARQVPSSKVTYLK